MKPIKIIISTLIALMALISCGQQPTDGPVSTVFDKYTIVYNADDDPDEGADIAVSLHKAILAAAPGADVKIRTEAGDENAWEFHVGNTGLEAATAWYEESHDEFDYAVITSGHKIILAGGSDWALGKCVSLIGEAISDGNDLSGGFSASGSIYGEMLFGYDGQANIRFFDWNVWNNGAGTSLPASWKPAWDALGKDPTVAGRLRGWIGCVCAYAPDIVSLQEMAQVIEKELKPGLVDKGYVYVDNYEPTSAQNWTPIFYNPATIKVEKAYFGVLPSKVEDYPGVDFNNGLSKTYTIALISHIPTSQKVIVANAHLWYQGESTQEGSDQARLEQMRVIKNKIDEIFADVPAPVVLMGDMNAKLSKSCIQLLVKSGYTPAWEAANLYGDASHGRHHADYNGFTREANGTALNDGSTTIDHMLVYNNSNLRVETFKRITPYFTMALSDHYPNYMDALLTERGAEAPRPQLTVSTSKINVESTAKTASFDISSNVKWAIECDNAAFEISPTSGEGNATVTVKFVENKEYTEQKARITVRPTSGIDGQMPSEVLLTVIQAAAPRPSMTISSSSASVRASVTSVEFSIVSNVAWTVTSNNSAFVPAPASGSGKATVKVTFPANDTESEVTAVMTIRGESVDDLTFTITQAAKEPEVPGPEPGSTFTETVDFLEKFTAKTEIKTPFYTDHATVSFTNGKNASCFYAQDAPLDGIRVYYNGGSMTVSSENKIVKLEITIANKDGVNLAILEANCGNFTSFDSMGIGDCIWTGDSNSVTINVNGNPATENKGQRRFQKVVITMISK